jgi:serine/threonine-protein kinase
VPIPSRPRRLGHWDVVVKIAGGGMATIYLGRSREGGGERLAAIKVIRHELRQDERFVRMFLDEARMLARLSHPNIAATYEFGTDAEEHFIAMELLVGRTLAEVWDACKERKLALRLEHAAWITARVADALHHAHELVDESGQPLHVVHRDVNPSNVFLTFDGDVKLFDFGLAKSASRRAASKSGIVKGKLPYLSPEQIAQLPLDRRSDIYMLGTTLWEMTTMRRLFKRADDADTLMAVRAGLVPDPRATVATYPESLWDVVRRALARDRDERYATAAELSRDLDAFVAAMGDDEDMALRTGAILDALFPGEREKRAMWLRSANIQRREIPRTTMPPPATLVGAHTPSMAPPPAAKPPPPPPARPAPNRPKTPRSLPKLRVPRG